ncbi:MAG: hypothetical protein A2Y17_06225 [Clostridiales bacterium GWF2_38_85]|nr:MAG: hypothetical protein A2Y17_06225 [Clostridiales bacterium GWF2_38_85]HBL85488.1 DNA-binding protein [Clostridiales bacterium]
MMDRVTVSSLFDVYGGLLTEKQQLMLDLYCNEDLSLAEISENVGITRQGVRDAVNKAVKILDDAEEKLHINEKNQKITTLIKEIIDTTTDKNTAAIAKEIISL